MKNKLTLAQFQALYELITIVTMTSRPETMEDKLLFVLLKRIYDKMYKMDLNIKKEYNLNLLPEEAMAFYMYFQDHTFGNAHHTGNLINTIRNNINRLFA